MSRIILKQYNDDETHIAVGWDRPCSTYFWQEFQKEPTIAQSGEGKWQVTSPAPGFPKEFNSMEEAEEHKWDDWQEMVRFAGYMPNEMPTLASFMKNLPDDLKPLVTEDVRATLMQHSMDPDSGSIVVNMASRSFKVEVQTLDGGDKWVSNAVRFATEAEAEQAAKDLAMRWMMVKEHRAAPSTDPVNYKWEDGKAVSV